MRAHRLAVLAMAVAACGPDTKEPAEHDRVCGHESPFRILELDDDRELAIASESRRVGDRRILRVADLAPPDDHVFFGPPSGEDEFWSVGECGESPLRLGDIDALTDLDHWPELMFDCREDGGLELVDPMGVRPRNRMLETLDCSYAETPWGLVDIVPIDEVTGALVLLSYPNDPWTETATATTLLDSIRISADQPRVFPAEREVLVVHDDEVLVLTPDEELVHLSLLDGSTAIEATNVRTFQVSEDAGWLVWQDLVPTGDDPDWPSGAIFVRDRRTAATYQLPDDQLGASLSPALRFIDRGLVLMGSGAYGGAVRLYRIPTLEVVELATGYDVVAELDDGRWLVGALLLGGSFELFDPATAMSEAFIDEPGVLRTLHADGVDFLRGLQHCCIGPEFRAEAPLWFVSFSGERRLVAHRATARYSYLSDGRVLTPLDVDAKWHGDLVVVAPEDQIERVVDDHTVSFSPTVVDDTILYGVNDDDRTGVWLARLAPTED